MSRKIVNLGYDRNLMSLDLKEILDLTVYHHDKLMYERHFKFLDIIDINYQYMTIDSMIDYYYCIKDINYNLSKLHSYAVESLKQGAIPQERKNQIEFILSYINYIQRGCLHKFESENYYFCQRELSLKNRGIECCTNPYLSSFTEAGFFPGMYKFYRELCKKRTAFRRPEHYKRLSRLSVDFDTIKTYGFVDIDEILDDLNLWDKCKSVAERLPNTNIYPSAAPVKVYCAQMFLMYNDLRVLIDFCESQLSIRGETRNHPYCSTSYEARTSLDYMCAWISKVRSSSSIEEHLLVIEKALEIIGLKRRASLDDCFDIYKVEPWIFAKEEEPTNISTNIRNLHTNSQEEMLKVFWENPFYHDNLGYHSLNKIIESANRIIKTDIYSIMLHICENSRFPRVYENDLSNIIFLLSNISKKSSIFN